ncbi:transmembrane protein 87A-like [Tubulanus polymorphus]|uniref:transmembrane protein 87A-like n=1 Tax=Tubulanus polymorphus TaxID=672921 RepID=UPI003DA5C8A7
MAHIGLFPLAITYFLCVCCYGLPEQGVWTTELDQNKTFFSIPKSMYNNSQISIKIECIGEINVDLNIGWVLRQTPCAEEYIGATDKASANMYFLLPNINRGYSYKTVQYHRSKTESHKCSQHSNIILKDESLIPPVSSDAIPLKNTTTEISNKASDKKAEENKKPPKTTTEKKSDTTKRVKRAAKLVPPKPLKATTTLKPTTAKPMKAGHNEQIDHSIVETTWSDGVYLFVIMIAPQNRDRAVTYKTKVTVWMKGHYGFLSAADWPLLPFYGVMCVVYVVFGLIWLVLAACNWRDLLRIQFWIGAVIILGMLEKAVFYAEYQTINYTGKSVRGAVIFAELVSCMKRSLARMLVVIVSLGFGIVKPRLGPMLHKVVLVGILYFILGSIEGCLRVLRPKSDPSNQALLASIPLAVLDSGICWWIFTSLVQTIRTLRLRRNVVKLSMYRHFTNTLIFAILASIAFMIWSIKEHKLATCLKDWKELWVDDAYWHLLFSVILFVIMVLWRPTNNNQRYAFSPLLDAADDDEDEDETVMNDAFDGMKMRSKNQTNGSPKQKDSKVKTEEDLKWIEENIPSSVADTALPSLLDSDEEIMTTKFEMSKME